MSVFLNEKIYFNDCAQKSTYDEMSSRDNTDTLCYGNSRRNKKPTASLSDNFYVRLYMTYQKVMSSDVFIDRTTRRSCQIETLLSLSWVDYFRNKVCCTSLSSALSFLHDVVHVPEVFYLVLLPCIHLVICNEDVIPIYN